MPIKASQPHYEIKPPQVWEQLKDHISKHLYLLFDFKELEKTVFGDIKHSRDGNYEPIHVFPSSTKDEVELFQIQEGHIFREAKRNYARKNLRETKYNQKVIFREEETNIELLATKVLEHLEISLKALMPQILSSMEYTKLIIDSFTELTTIDYEMQDANLGHFEEFIKQSKFYMDIEQYSDQDTNKSLPNDMEIRDKTGILQKVTETFYSDDEMQL